MPSEVDVFGSPYSTTALVEYARRNGWETVLLEMSEDLSTEEWSKAMGCLPSEVARICRVLGVRTRSERGAACCDG